MFCSKRFFWSALDTCPGLLVSPERAEDFSKESSCSHLPQHCESARGNVAPHSHHLQGKLLTRGKSWEQEKGFGLPKQLVWVPPREGATVSPVYTEKQFGKRRANLWWPQYLRPCSVPARRQFWWRQQRLCWFCCTWVTQKSCPLPRETRGWCEADTVFF